MNELLGNTIHFSIQNLNVCSEAIERRECDTLLRRSPLLFTVSLYHKVNIALILKEENTHFRYSSGSRPIALMLPSLAKQTWLYYIIRQRTLMIPRHMQQ